VYNQLSPCLLAVVSHVNESAVHCINPDCQRPYPQPWGNKFCNSCGAPLLLLDRYLPLQRLGSGGFAHIYTVWDQKTQTEKVLKVLLEDSPKARELFAQEAAVLKGLRHPGVPKVDSDGYFERNWSSPKGQTTLPCLVMEKINGQTLEEIQNKYPQGCPQEMVLNWLSQAVEILEDLHKRKIVHRDIKPSNLMLREKTNQLVLIDFGGVKQVNAAMFASQPRSTRLFSSGYSPPEQMTGTNVAPAADFYALGRTTIELLTGKYPPDLEDPMTGELRWRNAANVNPRFADLLDEMVQEDVKLRPTNAAIIQKRLGQISRPSPPQPRFFSKLGESIAKAIANFIEFLGNSTLLIFKAILSVVRACLDTIWTMILTCIGACLGTVAGFGLAFRTILGDRVAQYVSAQISVLGNNTQTVSGSEILLFAAAGLGTAWGLTLAGGFGQRRRYLVTGLLGIIAYGFAWLVLQIITPKHPGDSLVGLILTAVSLLTMSLGVRSHHIVHAVIAAFGTAIVFSGLIFLGFSPNVFHFSTSPHWGEILPAMAFFGLVGIFMSFWLGVSYYLIVPALRLLGWR
jgi:serine/threonine protein kinase